MKTLVVLKNKFRKQIGLLTLTSGFFALADIGLIHPSGTPAVVYLEQGKITYRRCFPEDLEVNRGCRVNGEPFTLSMSEFMQRLSMMAGLPDGMRELNILPIISTRLLRTEQLMSEATDLSAEDLSEAKNTLATLTKYQRRLLQIQHRVIDFLDTKQSKVLDALIRIQEYEEVFFALHPQVVYKHRPTATTYHARFHESDIDGYAIKDQCRKGWRFPTSEELSILSQELRTQMSSLLTHDYSMGNYGTAKGLVWMKNEGKMELAAVMALPEQPFRDRSLSFFDGNKVQYTMTWDDYVTAMRGAPSLKASIVCVRLFSEDLPYWEGK